MKNLLIIFLVLFTISCQREKMNEIGVGYNKSLIKPPIDNLPEPGNKKLTDSENIIQTDNSIVKSILENTNTSEVDTSIIEKIDNKSGYKTDENFFQWLFKGKSKR